MQNVLQLSKQTLVELKNAKESDKKASEVLIFHILSNNSINKK